MKKRNIIILVVSIVIVCTLIIGAVFIGIPTYLYYSAKKELAEVITTNSETGDTSTETMLEQLENQEKEMFNQKFLAYETEENETATYSNVLGLFSMIANSNSDNTERIVDVNGTVITPENIESLKAIINKDTKYTIKCILDDDGYVKTIELRYV